MKCLTPLVLLAGCTSLGPMPSTTGVSAVPAARPGGEVQGTLVPIFRLSHAVGSDDPDREDPDGESVLQLGGLIEPDRWLGIPGLIAGVRMFGDSGDVGFEPMVGYRRRVDERVAVAGVAFGTAMGADENGASYDAVRVGGEVAIDALAAQLATTTALHVQGAINATYLSASGRYCIEEATGNGRDCDQDVMVPMVDAELDGLYTAATLTLGLDIGRGPTGAFHSARLAGMFTVGHMPRLIEGRQVRGDIYLSGGLSLMFGFGAKE